MSFIHYQNFADKGIMGVWKITETIEELQLQLPIQWLANPEYKDKTIVQQQLEWLASRVALQQLAVEVGSPLVAMTKDEFGKPQCANQFLQLSLSHSFPFVAVAVHTHLPLGIDIEKQQAKIQRIAPRVFHVEELAWATSAETQTLVWCGKETLYKWYGKRGLDFKAHLKIVPLDDAWLGEIRNTTIAHDLQLYYHTFDDYHVVWGHEQLKTS